MFVTACVLRSAGSIGWVGQWETEPLSTRLLHGEAGIANTMQIAMIWPVCCTCIIYCICMKFWFSCNFVYMDRHCCNNWPKHQFAIRILYCVLISHICVPVLFQVRWTPPWGRLEMALSAVSLCRGHMNTWRQSILWCFFFDRARQSRSEHFFPNCFFLPSVSYILYLTV